MSFLINFNYNISGQKDRPKLVFLHGLMGFGQNWRKITQSFENDFEILVFDQRGHGKSFRPLTGYAPEDYADDLHIILEELHWDKINLVGHSMGGRNALNFAVRFPEKIDKLVIEDIGPEGDRGSVDYFNNLLGSVPTPFQSKLEAKEFFLNDFVQIHKNLPQPITLGQYLYANIIELPDGRADWRFSKNAILDSIREGRAKDRWDELESLIVPTLWIRGEQSKDLPVEIFREIPKRNHRVLTVQIEAAGHWVHFDQPQKFAQVLRDFLTGAQKF